MFSGRHAGSCPPRLVETWTSAMIEIARKRASASFLIMTWPPLRSLTGLS
jgi:hypothetical protein